MPLSKGAYYLEVPGARLGIILCHAYTGSTADVRPQAGLLNRQGYGVLCPLFTGHGTTDIQDILNAGPEIWWQDLQEALAFMKERTLKKEQKKKLKIQKKLFLKRLKTLKKE